MPRKANNVAGKLRKVLDAEAKKAGLKGGQRKIFLETVLSPAIDQNIRLISERFVTLLGLFQRNKVIAVVIPSRIGDSS